MPGKRKHENGGGPPAKRKRGGGQLLTVEDILSDKLTKLADKHWSVNSESKGETYDPALVESIYNKELKGFPIDRLMVLELSQYLERYLWPHFGPDSSSRHVMSIVMMVNEKFREGVSAWDVFQTREGVFPVFFNRVLDIEKEQKLTMQEKTFYIRFLINSFQSLENEMVRKLCLRMAGLAVWRTLNPGRLEKELAALFLENPQLKKHWNKLKKQEKKPAKKEQLLKQQSWLPALVDDFLNTLYSVPDSGEVEFYTLRYLERFVEFMIDLNVQLPTRRFFNTVLDEKAVLVKCQLAPMSKRSDAKLFVELVNMLKFYSKFEIDDHTGDALADDKMTERHCNRLVSLQRCSFKYFPDELRDLCMSQIAGIQTRQTLLPHFMNIKESTLRDLAVKLRLLDQEQVADMDRALLMEVMVSRFEKRLSQLDAINGMPLYPTESDLYDESVMPHWEYKGDACLALPKLNLMFLTLYDYLLRNFTLYRLESTYEIRQDLEEVIGRMAPRLSPDGRTVFTGWARMALPVQHFEIKYVSKPDLGDIKPARVKAELVFALTGLEPRMRDEWDSFRRHDVIFMCSIRPRLRIGDELDPNMPFNEAFGIEAVRGAEIVAILDADGKEIDEIHDDKAKLLRGDRRTITVLLDSAQFQKDVEDGNDNLYTSFNLVIRRRPKENNFKAVLETIRDLMNARSSVPPWIHDIFLGYGNPAAANYRNMEGRIHEIDYHDTFLDAEHVREALAPHGLPIKFAEVDTAKHVRPFRVRFPKEDEEQVIVVTPYRPDLVGPYPHVQPKLNAVRFTPVQVEAITGGINPGLTMVVGPPGTGKTDTAVQIILNLYKNFPEQRTILVTHSNQALNQLFEKIAALDIDPRHLLRLGRGHEDLATDMDYGRHGRVNYMLDQRLKALEEVQRLAQSLEVAGDVAYTCETAGHFFLFHVMSRWEQFENKLAVLKRENEGGISDEDGIAFIEEEFPFADFFANAPQPLFPRATFEDDWAVAHGCFRYLENIFQKLEECRAFELLRNGTDRANYLVTTQARIIAMTCTHAALKRRDLIKMGFKYDNLVMEEAAQILEVETFIPMLLQTDSIVEGCRLKRAILIGDHHQLPPVVQNMAFQKYGHLDQSMFTRFVRLQVPTVDLDMQGRMRPSMANLFTWRYKRIGDLPYVLNTNEYHVANSGFAHDFQFVDVGDLDGKGETTPNPYFYQNLAEAEYIVAVYMYMRLIGYPAEKISILTTYNGQKHLLRDVIDYRCAKNPAFGRPRDIATVDKFQGNQNDYILLSLVRTRNVGHVRDVRRLVVAVSRARLGLYIFGRKALFEQCFELTPAFSQLLARPVQLELTAGETWPTERKLGDTGTVVPIRDLTHMGAVVNDMSMQQLNQYQQTTPQQYAAQTMAPTSEDLKDAPER